MRDQAGMGLHAQQVLIQGLIKTAAFARPSSAVRYCFEGVGIQWVAVIAVELRRASSSMLE